MEEKIQRELIEKIFAKVTEYQEAQLKQIYWQIEQELSGTGPDYTVATILCKSEDVSRFWDGFVPLLSTGMLEPRWGNGAIERVYIAGEQKFLQHTLEKSNVYPAKIQTNYETYRILVKLKEVNEALEQTRTINKLMYFNGVDMPEVNDICIQKFYDVHFWQVNDRLRQDERIESIQVDWGQLKPYLQEEVSLLWNVKQVKLKENAFPSSVALINELKYDHEIILPHKESAYLIDIPEGEACQVVRKGRSMTIRNHRREYQNWNAYEIMPVPRESLKNEKCQMMTNGVNQDIFKGLQNQRALHTKCEIYRHAMAYEMACMFRKIEVQDTGELLFYPKEQHNYLNSDVMEYILKDMSVLYGGHSLTGRLAEDDK